MKKGIRSSIYFLVVVWGLSHFFASSFTAFDDAARESFKFVEAAAIKSQIELSR